jgi:hypothetical protein
MSAASIPATAVSRKRRRSMTNLKDEDMPATKRARTMPAHEDAPSAVPPAFAITKETAAAWAAEHKDADAAAQPLLDHVLHSWCQGDRALYERVLNWMAQLLQQSTQRRESALSISGASGSGKSLVVHKLGEIIGHPGFHASLGHPNEHARPFDTPKSHLLVAVDLDAGHFGERDLRRLSALAVETVPVYPVRYKIVGNNVRMIFTSIDDGALAGWPHLLRLSASDKYAGAQAHFDAVMAVPPEALAHVLYTRDISKVLAAGSGQRKEQ